MKISEKIIKLRKSNNLSQEEFGNKINVSRQAISKWENDEAKPDTEKIREIVKKFNISYEYLLNDEIENEEKIENTSTKKSKRKVILKVVLTIFIIYFLICIYKFITFYRFYLVANSFSEKNYSIVRIDNYENDVHGKNKLITEIKKVDNTILEMTYSDSKIIKDENGNRKPYLITYTDIDNRKAYCLTYDYDKEKYIYFNIEDSLENNDVFLDRNDIKRLTLDVIPSNFKQILLCSVNPMVYYVDIVNHEIKNYDLKEQGNLSVKLSHNYLAEKTELKTKKDKIVSEYSYDYVQDHFDKIDDPLEKYKDEIIFEEE